MIEIKTIAGNYQDRYLLSKSKFPCMISAVGTGKTLCLIMKIIQYCEEYPGTTALIVRREYTDLRDSTIKDFQTYCECVVGSDKNYKMANGSLIMFRHADEIQVLKNVNLGIAGIEQAEEFETDDQFQYLRDRLRQQNGADVRPLCVIANANGHNWIWNLWVNNAQTVNNIDQATGQYEYLGGEYAAWTANTFSNERNLPPDFIADLKRKETEAPSHYRQYVLNSFEVENTDDLVFPIAELELSKKIDYSFNPGYGHRILACDPSRFGKDTTCAVIIQQMGALNWEVIHLEEWGQRDSVYTVGRVNEMAIKHRVDSIIIDEDGLGGPIGDFIRARSDQEITGFRNATYSFDQNQFYGNARTAAAFKTKEMINKGWLKITQEKIIQELNGAFYFKYTTRGQRILLSKDQLRSKGIASPNAGDALCYAVSLVENVQHQQNRQYAPRQPQYYGQNWNPFAPDPQSSRRHSQYYSESDPFRDAGIP